MRVADPDRAAELLRAAGLTAVVDGDALVVGGVINPTVISRILGEQGLWVRELTPLARTWRASSWNSPGGPAPSSPVRSTIRAAGSAGHRDSVTDRSIGEWTREPYVPSSSGSPPVASSN